MEIKQEKCLNIKEKNYSKLSEAGNYYSRLSPGVSRFYMSLLPNIRAGLTGSKIREQDFCCFCGTILQPGNSSVRIKPKAKITKKILRLRKRESEGKESGVYQLCMLDKFRKRINSVVTKCHTCGKEDVKPGGEGVTKSKQKSTPAKKTPKLISKKNRKNKPSLDSGLGSLMTTHNQSVSLSSISTLGSTSNMVASLSSSLASLSSKSPSSLPSPVTSTPKVGKRNQNAPISSFKSPGPSGSLTSLNSVKSSGAGKKSSPGKKQSKKNNKKDKKKGLSVLQRMLSQENNSNKNQGASLKQFLSSL